MGNVLIGVLIPFLGTSLGASFVCFLKNTIKQEIQKGLLGFAAGIMIAAAVWSLLIPAIDMASFMGTFAFLPAATGFLLGMGAMIILDQKIPRFSDKAESGENSSAGKSSMLLLAVTIHNIPEGMAVGAVFAGMLADRQIITVMEAFALSIGIAIQNIPEGAIISMPVYASGASKRKALFSGILSGLVEPIGALLTVWLSGYLVPVLPVLLAFAAASMLYVVAKELLPESVEENSSTGMIWFTLGFVVMMILDVMLG